MPSFFFHIFSHQDKLFFMTTEKKIQSFIEGAFEHKDSVVELVNDLFSPNAFVDAVSEYGVGSHRMINLVQKYFSGFPDAGHVLHNVQEVGPGRVLAEFSIEGTHLDHFYGISPTGNKVLFNIMEVYQLQEGRVVDFTFTVNMLDAMQQLDMKLEHLCDLVDLQREEKFFVLMSKLKRFGSDKEILMDEEVLAMAYAFTSEKMPNHLNPFLERALTRIGCSTQQQLVQSIEFLGLGYLFRELIKTAC